MNLWQVISNEGIDKMFNLINLDKFSSQQLSKLSIAQIPTIVISNQNQQNDVYEGPQRCSQWLNNFTANRRQQIRLQVEQKMKLVQREQALARANNGPIEYIEDEMDGVTDTYAYTNTDLCQPKQFINIGQEENYNIMTPQVKENIIDNKSMNKQLSQLESNRNNDTNQFMKIMEQNQIQAVINKNNL